MPISVGEDNAPSWMMSEWLPCYSVAPLSFTSRRTQWHTELTRFHLAVRVFVPRIAVSRIRKLSPWQDGIRAPQLVIGYG